VQQIEKNQ
jgi:hypothetical protein